MQPYSAILWWGEFRSSTLQSAWKCLIQHRNPITAIYQSPAYFDYLLATKGRSDLDVLTICDTHNGSIVGVVPVQRSVLALPFAVGETIIARLRVKSLVVLGSEPMAPADSIALDELFSFASKQYPQTQVIEMYSVPLEGPLWRYLLGSNFIRTNFFVYVMDGFRDSFSVRVPETIEAYFFSLSRKRRYNFARQKKILERYLGSELDLHLIENPEDISLMLKSLKDLHVDSAHRSLLTEQQYVSAATNHVLRCFLLMSGNRAIGLAVGIKSQSTYLIHRFFYDPLLAKFSPGTTLWQLVLQYLIREAVFQHVGMGYGSPLYRALRRTPLNSVGEYFFFVEPF